jgi:tetratricopeptide (TPR) repeat protein
MRGPFVCLLGLLFLTSQAWAQSDDPPPNPKAKALELFQQGRLKDAIPELQKSLEKTPSDVEVRLHLAFAYDRLGSTDDAIAEYRRVIELEPNSYFAHNNLGVLYDKRGLYDEAIAAFENAARIDPKNSGASKNLETARKNKAAIQERQAQIKKAENAAAINPKDPQASFNVARLHAHYGNRELALQWLDRARRQGYKELASVKNDPAFKNLRDDRDFELILVGK